MILVDCDPDGLNILFCYRYGSARQRAPKRVPVSWWGIKTGHILDIGNKVLQNGRDDRRTRVGTSTALSQGSTSASSISSTACREPISHLSMRDRKLAISIMKKVNGLPQDDETAEELRMELQRMLMLGVKTEIQWLDESGSITQWLDRQIRLDDLDDS